MVELLMKKEIKSTTILVTGATGFLGSHLTRALCTEGYKVIISHREGSSFEKIKDIRSKIVSLEY